MDDVNKVIKIPGTGITIAGHNAEKIAAGVTVNGKNVIANAATKATEKAAKKTAKKAAERGFNIFSKLSEVAEAAKKAAERGFNIFSKLSEVAEIRDDFYSKQIQKKLQTLKLQKQAKELAEAAERGLNLLGRFSEVADAKKVAEIEVASIKRVLVGLQNEALAMESFEAQIAFDNSFMGRAYNFGSSIGNGVASAYKSTKNAAIGTYETADNLGLIPTSAINKVSSAYSTAKNGISSAYESTINAANQYLEKRAATAKAAAKIKYTAVVLGQEAKEIAARKAARKAAKEAVKQAVLEKAGITGVAEYQAAHKASYQYKAGKLWKDFKSSAAAKFAAKKVQDAKNGLGYAYLGAQIYVIPNLPTKGTIAKAAGAAAVLFAAKKAYDHYQTTKKAALSNKPDDWPVTEPWPLPKGVSIRQTLERLPPIYVLTNGREIHAELVDNKKLPSPRSETPVSSGEKEQKASTQVGPTLEEAEAKGNRTLMNRALANWKSVTEAAKAEQLAKADADAKKAEAVKSGKGKLNKALARLSQKRKSESFQQDLQKTKAMLAEREVQKLALSEVKEEKTVEAPVNLETAKYPVMFKDANGELSSTRPVRQTVGQRIKAVATSFFQSVKTGFVNAGKFISRQWTSLKSSTSKSLSDIQAFFARLFSSKNEEKNLQKTA